jgi:uncharacterized protein (TIGR02466 family)
MKDIKIVREEWWPTPIWYSDIGQDVIDPVKLAKECVLEKSMGAGRDFSDFGLSWASDNIIDKVKNGTYPMYQKLAELVESVAVHVAKEYGLYTGPKIDQTWCNFQYPGGIQTSHIHACSLVSLYYVQSPNDTAKIWFKPGEAMGFSNKMFTPGETRFTFEKVQYSPTVGRLFFFPSWLMHHVVINQSDQDRISVSFNLI